MKIKEVTFNGLGQQVFTGKLVEDKNAPLLSYITGTPYQGVGEIYTFNGTTGEINTLSKDADNNPKETIKQNKGKYTKAFVVLGSMVMPYGNTFDFLKQAEGVERVDGETVFEDQLKNTGRAHIFGFWVDVNEKGFKWDADTQKDVVLFSFKSYGVGNFEKAVKAYTTANARSLSNSWMVLLPYAHKESANGKNFNKLEFDFGVCNGTTAPESVINGIREFEASGVELFSLGELLQIRCTHEKMPPIYCKGMCHIPETILDAFNGITLNIRRVAGGIVFNGSNALREGVQNLYGIAELINGETPSLENIELPALPVATLTHTTEHTTATPDTSDPLPF